MDPNFKIFPNAFKNAYDIWYRTNNTPQNCANCASTKLGTLVINCSISTTPQYLRTWKRHGFSWRLPTQLNSTLPTLGLIIRYVDFDQGKVVDTFYRLLQVNRGDAETVVQAILRRRQSVSAGSRGDWRGRGFSYGRSSSFRLNPAQTAGSSSSDNLMCGP